jgi:hypothetical protein
MAPRLAARVARLRAYASDLDSVKGIWPGTQGRRAGQLGRSQLGSPGPDHLAWPEEIQSSSASSKAALLEPG